MPPVQGASPAHHLFTVVLNEGLDRDGARAGLAERGVQTSLHYPPLHRFSAFEQEADVPFTEQYAQRAITLPLFPAIEEAQIELVVESLAQEVG
jgi:dTDP-4-amino-4,6-dideoxygalactose transaminase